MAPASHAVQLRRHMSAVARKRCAGHRFVFSPSNLCRHPAAGVYFLGDGVSPDGTVPIPLETVFSLPPAPAVLLVNLSNRLPAANRAVAAAFLANGSSAVVLNAAPLTRKAKKLFGESFYTALQTGVPVPAALRSAQTMMAGSRELSAPFFWAPLMLWGKGSGGGTQANQR